MSTGNLNLDAILEQVGTSPYDTEAADAVAGEQAAAAEEAPGPLDQLTADVQLTVPDDLVVQGDDLAVPGAPIGLGALTMTLGGDLRATKAPGSDPRIVGTVNTVRGTYDFQGRRFTIVRGGTVRFEGLDELDPTLDVRAERVIQGVTTQVAIGGVLSDPEVRLSSVPPLEEGDILALIVFNQPLNQLGQGERISLARRARAWASRCWPCSWPLPRWSWPA